VEPDGAFSIAELMLNIQKSVTYVLNQECYLCTRFDLLPMLPVAQ